MTEPEQAEIGVLELGMSLAVVLPEDEGVAVVHMVATDPPGHFRLRRGEGLEAAYRADEEEIMVDPAAAPWEWAVLRETGLEVKLVSMPKGGFAGQVEDGPLRVAVRPRVRRERG